MASFSFIVGYQRGQGWAYYKYPELFSQGSMPARERTVGTAAARVKAARARHRGKGQLSAPEAPEARGSIQAAGPSSTGSVTVGLMHCCGIPGMAPTLSQGQDGVIEQPKQECKALRPGTSLEEGALDLESGEGDQAAGPPSLTLAMSSGIRMTKSTVITH